MDNGVIGVDFIISFFDISSYALSIPSRILFLEFLVGIQYSFQINLNFFIDLVTNFVLNNILKNIKEMIKFLNTIDP